MKHILHCTKAIRLSMMAALMLMVTAVQAQITSVHGTVSDDMGPLMGATVCEIDANGRIIESALTDMNGNFTMKIRNPKDKLQFAFVGLKTVTLPIDKTTYNVMMQSAMTLQVVEVKATKKIGGNNLAIPEREISFSTQSLNMSEFEGLGSTTVDEMLQGRIAGLDLVMNSGNLGSGSTMRLRGASSLSTLTDANPLIVIDGNIRSVDMSTFDLSSANDEQFAQLLNINPEDIEEIRVLKDAAATAVYGSQGGNGVIELTTKRGARGKPQVTYSLKLTSTYQPDGYDLLNGDDYTMLLKESYFNPQQSDGASNIPELNYDPTFSEYEQYNNNTDWRDEVTQWGLRQNHYVTISGGGEKAAFRVSAGYDHETGTIIEQKLQRFTTRMNLDYNISDRIKVQTNFALTYTKNERNSDDLLALAMKKMPNMSIYEQYPVGHPLQGQNTSAYYTMLQSASSEFNPSNNKVDNQKAYVNPIASAHLAQNDQTTYDMAPELIINYRLLGMDEDHWQLNWRGSVIMNIFNEYVDKFYPSELKTIKWNDGVNSSYAGNYKSVAFNTKQTLTLIPAFKNKDHSLMMMGRFELTSGSSTGQNTSADGLPSGGVTSPDAGGRVTDMGSSYAEWRSMYYTFSAHYAYKGRYMLDASLRADGTTKFGPNNRWGYFPALSLRWNIIDEPWMEPARKWLSMLSLRPSWGRVGRQPGSDYLYTSTYSAGSTYIDMTSVHPNNIRLTDLKWEMVTSYNLGMDFGFWDDRLKLTLEGYISTTTDMLMKDYRIPSNTGFNSLPYRNNGKMRNSGWEFHINTNKLIKKGKFSMDLNANFGNNYNEILEMDEYILNSLNSTYGYGNGEWLQRVQLNNSFGSIYGFRYKGVYQYNYDTFKNMTPEQRQQFLAEGKTAPVAFNAAGNLVLDSEGNPVRMMYNYSNDASGKNYKFSGGDAIYEDINHDGQINALDIVYLGNSLPKLTGGFGFTFNYGDWRLNTQFVYRLGYKILNMARLNAEAMTGNDNQSQAVNYRWRKEGDVTSIPRAMFGNTSNYNTLVSDRFVENGDYLRVSYIQLSYRLPKKWLKPLGLNQVSMYASANNPLVLTEYSGVDPDVSNSGYAPAIDWSQTPRSRSYTFGLTVGF
ncbi:MAG: SusC/RagA family TonB-linked outer membrane protein [Bacteroidaceae bacterium]|nr:SusC/RagA family TonB-linked outer membrane protein [Bacteroidaceae bacterium]